VNHPRSQPSGALQPARWAITLVALAIVAAMTAPIGAFAAQTPVAAPGDGVISVVPDTALVFAQVNLDPESEQIVLARQLSERAGLGDPLAEMSSSGDFPANANAGVIVTSIPEIDDVEAASVAVDPMAATDTLDTGGYAVILSADDIQAFYDGELADIEDQATSGGEVVETEYGGITITSYQPASDDEYDDPQAIAMVGDYVVAAMRAEDIQPVIDTFNGDTPSLSADENYQAVNALLPAESIASGYANGPAILESVQATSPDVLDIADPRVTSMLNSWSGFALTAEQDGFRLETKAIPSGDAFDEITPIDGSFYDKVPSDAVFAINGTNIDANGALTMLSFIFASEMIGEDVMATPAADIDLQATQEQVFAQAEQMLGFNIKTDLIDHLNGEFGLSVSVSDITSEVPTVNALIVSHVDDPEGVASVMTKVAMIVGAGLGDQTAAQEKDVNGSTVSVVDISETGVADTVEFGVVGEDLVIGVGSGMDDYANGADNPMSADPNFNAVMEHMPSEYGSLTYVNMPVVMQLVMGFSDSMSGGASVADADEACGDYASQDEAQTAYDADQFENYMLDQDFDGEACEDFFGGTPAASPAAQANPYANVLGLATVTTQEDGVYGTTTFLMIGGE
jgi:hypothetical protein